MKDNAVAEWVLLPSLSDDDERWRLAMDKFETDILAALKAQRVDEGGVS